MVVEDAFRDVLARWAAGSSSAPKELSDLQQQVIENKAGRKIDAASLSTLGSTVARRPRRQPLPRRILPGLFCLAQIQNHTLEQIEELDPEGLFPWCICTSLLASVRGDFEDWTEEMDALWAGDPGESPRLLYSNPRGEEIERIAERLGDQIRDRLPALAAALERLSEERQESDQQVFPECRGTLSW